MALIFYPYAITQTDRTAHTRVTAWRVSFLHNTKRGNISRATAIERAINKYGCAVAWVAAAIALAVAAALAC